MIFDEMARGWDTRRRGERAAVLAEKIRAAMGVRETALDFGCGTGLLTFPLAPYVEVIYGHDTSIEMRGMFLEKIAASGAGNVRFLGAEELDGHRFDAIFTSMVMHHIRDYRAKLARLKGLLNPGGVFLWIDLDPEGGAFHKGEPGFDGHDGFDRGEVRAALLGCGFRAVSIETAYEGVKIVDGADVPYTLFLAAAE